MDELGQLVCVTGEHATLSTHVGRLRVERDGQVLYDLPWNNLQAVILFGPHTLTTPAMQTALKENVPVHFAGSTGGYRGVLWTGRPTEPGCGLWLRQASLFADPSLALVLAREIVAARIRHLRETLRLRGAAAAADRLKIRLAKVDDAGGLDALNGLEGESTREFFQEAGKLLPAEWGFSGRNRRPPRDPFNALLSVGYTLLHGYVETLLHADGLLPWLGFYHQAHGRHATLASDLMEPFRHLVERTALSAIQRHELNPDDFFSADNGMNVYLVCFDITDDRNRGRVGKELLAYGERVQKSVFEIVIRRTDELEAIRCKLAPLLEEGDDLRFYRLCADCRSQSSGIHGEPLPHFAAAVVI